MAETKDKAAEKPAKSRASRPRPKARGRTRAALPAPPIRPPRRSRVRPRLKTYYDKVIRANLAKEFGLSNTHEVPRILKIVLNVGMGEAARTPKMLEAVVDELGLITGQKATIRRSKKAIANFNLRAGLPVGATVTLRNARMYEFLDRFINIAVPRIRDFRGLPNKSFDGRGNYTLGIKEQMIFPEIDFDKVEKIHGMDITVVTNAGRDDLAMSLLREFGWPFRGETPAAGGVRR